MSSEILVGTWRFDPAAGELSTDYGTLGDRQQRLHPKSAALLLELIEEEGRVRSREELLSAVWGDSFVGEAVLTHCIWELRRAFGDDARQPKYIQTVPKRGYRLVARVQPAPASNTDTSPQRVSDSQADNVLSNDLAEERRHGGERRREHRRERQQQLILLDKVERFWIVSLLKETLVTPSLDLRMRRLARAVFQPWRLKLSEQEVGESSEISELPQLFEDSGRALLILGEPGSGKTTALLMLARHAIAQARGDLAEPIPVVLRLASWRRGELLDWVVEELGMRYQVPAAVGRRWLLANHLMLLLDGLDEVAADSRRRSVEAINRFRNQQGFAAVALTCRSAEYRLATTCKDGADRPLRLGAAVGLEPIDSRQAIDFLRAHHPGADLSELTRPDSPRLELLDSPLMLRWISRAYVERSNQSSPLDLEDERRTLVGLFIDRLIEHRDSRGESVTRQPAGLGWLARSMLDHNQSILHLECLQPSWLDSTGERLVYLAISRLAASLMMATCWLVVYWQRFPDRLPLAPLITGVLGGLAIAVLDSLWWRLQLTGRRWAAAIYLLASVLLVVAISSQVSNTLDGTIPLSAILGPGLCFLLIFGLNGWHRGPERDIATVEALVWSWREALRGALLGALVGAILRLLVIAWLNLLHPDSAAAPGSWAWEFLHAMLVLGCFGAVWLGLLGRRVERSVRPNQGIWLSARNALVGGLLLAGAVLSAGLLARGLQSWHGQPLRLAVRLGEMKVTLPAIAGGLGSLWFGGFDLLKHLSLRALLRLRGKVPARLVNFLEDQCRSGLLRRVGGGYIFAHRYLMEHLARGSVEERSAHRSSRYPSPRQGPSSLP